MTRSYDSICKKAKALGLTLNYSGDIRNTLINAINADFANKATDNTMTVFVNLNFYDKNDKLCKTKRFTWHRLGNPVYGTISLGDLVDFEVGQYARYDWCPTCINSLHGFEGIKKLNISLHKFAPKMEFCDVDTLDFTTLAQAGV